MCGWVLVTKKNASANTAIPPSDRQLQQRFWYVVDVPRIIAIASGEIYAVKTKHSTDIGAENIPGSRVVGRCWPEVVG